MVELFAAIGWGQWFGTSPVQIELTRRVALLIPSAVLFGAILARDDDGWCDDSAICPWASHPLHTVSWLLLSPRRFDGHVAMSATRPFAGDWIMRRTVR